MELLPPTTMLVVSWPSMTELSTRELELELPGMRESPAVATTLVTMVTTVDMIIDTTVVMVPIMDMTVDMAAGRFSIVIQ